MPTAPAIGKDIDSWCTRCRMMLAHTVEAVVNGRVTRVHCNTCGGQHAHRARPPGTGTGSRARTTRTEAAKPARDYAALLRSRDPATARPYATTERFKDGELIRHPTFGLGLITALRDGNKIEVVFADGSKTLIHRR
jgi:hypothetical protein